MKKYKKTIAQMLSAARLMDDRSLEIFINEWVKTLKKERKEELLKKLYMVAVDAYLPNSKIERWMEKKFKKDISLTPKIVAYQYRHVTRLASHAEPYLRSIARKVKKRLTMQNLRKGLDKSEIDS